MDLSTPRGAITHFLDLIRAGLDESDGKSVGRLYDILLGKLDAGDFTPETVEMLHRVTKEGCEAMHRIIEVLKSGDHEEPVEEMAVQLRNVIAKYVKLLTDTLIAGSFSTKEMEDILGALETLDKNRRKEDNYDTVD